MGRAGFAGHPFDTPLSGGLRFLVEVIAWIAAPWAAAEESTFLAVGVMIVLVGLPAVFSTPGDKRKVVVATPGPIRVAIELILHAVAAVAPWLAWPAWIALATTIVVIAALVLGLPRLRWLMQGAPQTQR